METILDKWELEPGDPLTEFMEKAVRDNDFVLIICTPGYKDRSDRRVGGVGYEEDIMTAEVLTERNQRKFKPVLRSGEWKDAAPAWLKGKVFVDLRGDTYSEENYWELVASLLGTLPKAPPVKMPNPKKANPLTPLPDTESPDKPFEPIKILGVIEEEVGTPRNDGTPGSALYEVPFRFSRTPPGQWVEFFLKTWDFPSQFTSMHRPGIASIYGDRLILDGTSLDEVQGYHRDTLKVVLDETNKLYNQFEVQQRQRADQERQHREERERATREAAKKITFD